MASTNLSARFRSLQFVHQPTPRTCKRPLYSSSPPPNEPLCACAYALQVLVRQARSQARKRQVAFLLGAQAATHRPAHAQPQWQPQWQPQPRPSTAAAAASSAHSSTTKGSRGSTRRSAVTPRRAVLVRVPAWSGGPFPRRRSPTMSQARDRGAVAVVPVPPATSPGFPSTQRRPTLVQVVPVPHSPRQGGHRSRAQSPRRDGSSPRDSTPRGSSPRGSSPRGSRSPRGSGSNRHSGPGRGTQRFTRGHVPQPPPSPRPRSPRGRQGYHRHRHSLPLTDGWRTPPEAAGWHA
jgi:hypothetical protein